MSSKYIVQRLEKQNIAEAWSTERLPFEPKGWLSELRNEVRTTVSSLENIPNHVLHAIYGAYLEEFCDVENVLFYNVGAKYFARLAQLGIRFERSFSYPDPPRPLPDPLHYNRYTTADVNAGFLYWRVDRTLAQWNNVTVPPLSSTVNPAFIWYSMMSNQIDVLHIHIDNLARFGLRVMIMTPSHKPVNVASVMKPLVDGLIASFHTHNGDKIEQLSQRIGKALGQNASTIAELLRRSNRGILGERPLLWLRDRGIQWNPSDDICLAAELLIQPYSGTNWLISGMLFEIDYKGIRA